MPAQGNGIGWKNGGMGMERSIGYRLMQGKNGISGHVRKGKNEEQLIIRGLEAGGICDLFIIEEKGLGQPVSLQADGQGQIIYRSSRPLRYFAAIGGRVILWEREGRQDENYLQACALLLKSVPEQERADKPAKREEETAVVEEMAETINEAVSPAEIPGDPMPASVASAPSREEPPLSYSLRSPGTGEAVDALPTLIWPENTKGMEIYFSSLSPFAPFDLPGWRFVRAPSPVKECAYCALGYTADGGRVKKIAYALPGVPFYPPANLSGYRYHPGRTGQGYWVAVQEAEK